MFKEYRVRIPNMYINSILIIEFKISMLCQTCLRHIYDTDSIISYSLSLLIAGLLETQSMSLELCPHPYVFNAYCIYQLLSLIALLSGTCVS